MNAKNILSGMLMGLALVLVMDVSVGAAEGRGRAERPKKEKKDKRESKEKSVVRGRYAEMVKALQMNEAQVRQLEAEIQSYQQARKQWEQDNKARMDELKAQAKAAREAGDKDKAKQIGKQMGELTHGRRELEMQHGQRVQGILNEAQQTQWKQYRLTADVMGDYRKAELTDAQQQQVRQLVLASEAPLSSADRKVRGAAVRKLREQIAQDVLTAEQREKLKAPKAARPAKAAEAASR